MKKLTESIERLKRTLVARDPFDPRIRGSLPPRIDVEGKRVLLVYLFGGLGDLLLLAPVVRALAHRRPKSIGLAVPPLGKRLFRILGFEDAKIDLHPPAAALEASIAKKRYDIAVDLTLSDGVPGRALVVGSGAGVRLGWMKPGETLESAGLTFGTPDLRHETLMHWSRYTALPLAPLGVTAPDFRVELPRSKPAEKKARALWEKDRPRLLVVPGGRAEERRWNADRFVEVAAWARREKRASVVVLGGPSEAKAMRALARAVASHEPTRKVSAYTGKDLAVLLELVRSAHVVVTNDTGPMHLAFLTERPTIAIFQHMSPLVWGPPKSDPRFVILKASGQVDAGREVWTRLVMHHLDAQLSAVRAD